MTDALSNYYAREANRICSPRDPLTNGNCQRAIDSIFSRENESRMSFNEDHPGRFLNSPDVCSAYFSNGYADHETIIQLPNGNKSLTCRTDNGEPLLPSDPLSIIYERHQQ